MKRYLLKIVLSMTQIAWVMVLLTSTLRAETLIKIGVLTDLSGPASYYGQQTRVGALLAAQELTQQGKRIKIIFEDSALNTRQGVSAAQKLIQIDQVDALYVDFTPIAVAVSALAHTNKKLMIYGAAAESVVKSNEYAFKTYSDYIEGCEAVAREFNFQGIKRVGILHAEAEYGDLCAEGVKKVYSEAVEQFYKRGDPVVTQVLVMKSKGVEAIINGSFEGDMVNMLRAIADLKYVVKVGGAKDSLTAGQVVNFAEQLKGAITFGLDPLLPELRTRAQAIDGGATLPAYEGVGLSYLHIMQAAVALESCQGKDITCTVSEMERSPASAVMGFSGWKGRKAQLHTTVREFKEGEFKPVSAYVTGTTQ
jgi:ABC-type branched-subunit amino acid transport system substrate-binding protein